MAKEWTMRLDGLDRVRRELRPEAKRALHDGGEIVLAESDTHVPIEEGTLSRSGHVIDDPSPRVLRVGISYDTPYAAVQHEDMTLHHDAGRSAKYLERAMMITKRRVLAHVAEKLGLKP